jgi:hypothetical protein
MKWPPECSRIRVSPTTVVPPPLDVKVFRDPGRHRATSKLAGVMDATHKLLLRPTGRNRRRRLEVEADVDEARGQAVATGHQRPPLGIGQASS